MRRTTSLTAAAVAGVFLFAGCGDDSEDPSDGDSQADAGSASAADTDGNSGSGGSGSSESAGGETEGAGGTDGDGDIGVGHECTPADPALELAPCGGAPATEQEPNQIASQATAACIGEVVRGNVPDSEDIDVFEFEVPAAAYGGYVVVRAENTDPLTNLDLELRSAEDNAVIQGDYGGDAGGDRVVHAAVAPGRRFRAFVNENHWGGLGSYDLRVQWFPAFDCYEPNDSERDARGIPVNEPIHAKLFAGYVDSGKPEYLDTVDWYRVQLDAGPVQIHGTQSPTDVQLYLELLDRNGNSLTWSGAQGDGAPVTLSAEVEAGEHFVVVGEDWTPATARGWGTDVPPHFVDDYQLLVEQP